MEYQRPAIEERVEVGGPVIEGVTLSPGQTDFDSPIWKREAPGGGAPSPEE